FHSPFHVSLYHFLLFFFNPTPTTEIYTLSLHDALPISKKMIISDRANSARAWMNSASPIEPSCTILMAGATPTAASRRFEMSLGDRKSTRLNSSHVAISYAVFCLKKKKEVRSKGVVLAC